MARKEEKIGPQIITTVPDMKIDVEEMELGDVADEQSTELSPLQKIIAELYFVVEGGSVGSLRTLVSNSCPKSVAETQSFIDKMRRLRDACEAALQTATETCASLSNR